MTGTHESKGCLLCCFHSSSEFCGASSLSEIHPYARPSESNHINSGEVYSEDSHR